MLKILKYSFFDLIRSRWSLVYFLFYFITASVLIHLSADPSKVVVSLMNILLILSPLIGMLFGVINYYNSREFIELLLAQPIPRTSIFLGMLFGTSLSLISSLCIGLILPLFIFGISSNMAIGTYTILLLTGVFLTFIFTALAFAIALFNENKLKGFGIAIIVWLFLAFIYDGIFLVSLLIFESYPLENFAIVMSVFNPIDLSRILIMLQLDISALMGYTGAVFNKFFGTHVGMSISLSALLVWCIFPVWLIIRKGLKKDF